MCRKTGSFMSKGIKGYLAYLDDRIKYLSTVPSIDNLNELEYCKEMLSEAKNWGKNHKVFYQYIRGYITPKEAIALLGTSERSFYRLMATQRGEFVCVLRRLEVQLMSKYGLN